MSEGSSGAQGVTEAAPTQLPKSELTFIAGPGATSSKT